VNYICKKLSISRKDTVVVGDSIVDLKMAKSACVRFVGVKTGLHSPDFLKSSELLINDLNDLDSVL